jgi:Polyketide cyclase / dehydrase and lipid transport
MVKNTLLVILGLLVLAVLVIALMASQRPDTFRVSRSATIAAPADKLFPMINNLREFDSWNPYSQKDPQMKSSYSGPTSGPGAHSDFESKKAGTGSLEIVQATPPSEVRMRLNMTAPMKGDNTVVFTLAPQGNTTQATWTMEGPAPFIAKCMGVIFNMDKMVGADFEAGLANLKARAEKA